MKWHVWAVFSVYDCELHGVWGCAKLIVVRLPKDNMLVALCVLLSSYVYLLFYVCIAVFTLDAGLLAKVSIRKVLRPATSTQVFLGFPVSISRC